MRLRILPVLVLTIALMLAAFAYAFQRVYEARIDEVRDVTAQRAKGLVQGQLAEHTALMSAALEAITRDELLMAAMESGDRDALLARGGPLFKRLRGQFQIDHFYFHRPDRINLVRLHEPDHDGDLIDRWTLVEAQRTGEVRSGIEQGPTGNCTLRVVYPWRRGERLLGYVELGTEFETVAQRVGELLGVELVVTIDKRLLNRAHWERRNQKLGRQSAWGDFPDVVVIDKTVGAIPAELAHYLAAGPPADGQATIDDDDGAVTQVVFLPLSDVAGHALGHLVVLRDLTAITAGTGHSLRLVGGVCGGAGVILILFFYVFLGRVGRDLHERAVKLADANAHLERRVSERTAELEATHKQLLEVARKAGMAEVATGVLHNVGNVLTSVNVSANVASERLRTSKLGGLVKAANVLRDHEHDLAAFLTSDEKGKVLPSYLLKVATLVHDEHQSLASELGSLSENVEHIKQIVAMQQSYARSSAVTEVVDPADVVEDAVRMNEAAFGRHGVRLERDYGPKRRLTLDRHRILQILINLLSNAKYAMDAVPVEDRRITLRVSEVGGDAGGGGRHVRVQVTDRGVGIAPEHLTRIFSHGFTTRVDGHGFGLHTSALAAQDMGATLTAHSDGPGKGATFTLELPIPAEASHNTDTAAGAGVAQ